MKTVKVSLGKMSYQCIIDHGAFDKLPSLLQKYTRIPKKGVMITHQRILDWYGKKILKKLKKNDWNIDPIIVPEGERSKTLFQVEKIYHQMLRLGQRRS